MQQKQLVRAVRSGLEALKTVAILVATQRFNVEVEGQPGATNKDKKMSNTPETQADKFLVGVLQKIRLEATYPEYFKMNDRKAFYSKLRPLYRHYVEKEGWRTGDLLISIIVTVASDKPLSKDLLTKIFETDKEYNYKILGILSRFIDVDLIFEHWLDELEELIKA